MSQLPEARFLNLEYIFNKFFGFLARIAKILKIIINKLIELFLWLGTNTFRLISTIISLLLLTGIIYLLFKISRIKKEKIVTAVSFLAAEQIPGGRTSQWEEIKKQLESLNEKDWCRAILDADSIIDDILQKVGYKGEDLSDRLKVIESSDFENLKNVWEAHQIRNKIVHEGEEFVLTKELAKSTLEKYEKALKELKYI